MVLPEVYLSITQPKKYAVAMIKEKSEVRKGPSGNKVQLRWMVGLRRQVRYGPLSMSTTGYVGKGAHELSDNDHKTKHRGSDD